MKKKYKRFGKSFISIMLTILMLVSSMMLGSIATIEASAVTFSDSNGILYLRDPSTMSMNATTKWLDASAQIRVYFYGTGDGWSTDVAVDTTKKDSEGYSVYYVKIPKGTWTNIIVVRKGPNNTGGNWNEKWGQSSDIALSTNNYLTSYVDRNYTLGSNTWSTFQPSATVTLTAPTSQTVTTGASVTCSSTNTVDSTFSTGTTAYKVYNSAGTSEVGSSVASVSGSTITFNTAGTYQVKAALTYTANGFSSISDTVYSDAATITVEDPSGPVTGVRVAAKYGSDGSTFGTLTTEPSVTITGDNSATANLSGGTVSITGSGTVSAAESFQISGTTYAFTKWTSSGSGTFADDSNNETTFNARTENEIVTANYTKCYNVNVTQTSGGRISVDRNLVQAGGSFTVTAVPDALYEVGTLTVTGGTPSTASFTSNVCTYSPMPASDVTISAAFTTNYRRIYVYNRFNWGNLHLHYWGGRSESTWPGVLMTKDKEYSGLYYLDIPDNTTNIIFNSGVDSDNKNYAQSREISISSDTSNCVLVPDNEEVYTSGQWSNLEDYTTVTSIYDSMEHYKIYYQLHSKMESDSKDLYVWSQTGDGISTYKKGDFRKQLTRVYDYVDSEGNYVGKHDLYFFIAWKYDSSTGIDKNDASDKYIDGNNITRISQYHYYLYDDIKNNGYLRFSTVHSDYNKLNISFYGSNEGNGDGSTTSFTQRIAVDSSKNQKVFRPNGNTFNENNKNHGTVERVGIEEKSLSDISYNVSQSNKTTATVYAKSGTIRNDYDKYSRMADVQELVYNDTGATITSSTGWSHSTNGGSYRERVAAVEKGRTFTVSVKIKDDFKYKYYVKAWCINGDTYNIIEQDEAIKHKGTGEYTCEYTIGDNEDGPIEITPIYFAFVNNKDANDYITFHVEDFEDVKDAWGGTLACYAYYRTGDGGSVDDKLEPTVANDAQKAALGGYPGQPMVYENGSYYMQIPRTRTVNENSETVSETVKGITLNNYVWDFVHSQNIKGLWSDRDRQNANCQTYDYDDFVALATVTNDIIFNFKNRTINNPGDGSTAQANATKGNCPNTTKQTLSSYTNGWNVLTDYYDYPVDLFSNRLTNADYDTEEKILGANANIGSDSNMIYVVSNGYEIYNDYIGQYATKWYVYDHEGNFLGALPPSVFYTATPNGTFSSDSLMNFGVASGFKSSTVTPNDGTHTTYAAVAEYLWNQCKGKPVVITYETALRSVGAQGAQTNPGLRNDGRWYYSIANSKIHANIVIEYEDDNGNFVPDSTLVENTTTGQGSVTKAKAYFTNESSEGNINSTKTSMTDVTQTKKNSFRFVADPSSTVTQTVGSVTTTTTYVFKGWYLTTGGGVYNPINVGDNLSNPVGKRLMNSNATFVARYEKVTSQTLEGSDTTSPRYLTVNHNLLANGPTPASGTKPTVHNGTGTPLVTVEIRKQTTSGGTTTTTVLKSYKNAPGTNFVKIDPKYLTDNNYKVRVTLTTNTDSETSFVSTYQYDSSYTEAVTNNNGCTSVTGSSKTVVYEYTVSDLFGYDGTSTTSNLKTLNYYTDLSTNYIKVVFKYFDRNITANEATDINQTATEVPVYGSTKSADGTSFSLENAITDAFGSGNVSASFNNVTDQYVFWTTQSKARTGFLNEKDYHHGGQLYSSTYPNAQATILDYHRTCYGDELDPRTDADKWVTYTTLSGTTAVVTDETTDNGSDYANIDYITVWCYNYPKTYNVHLYMPNPEKVYVTTGESINVEDATSNSTVWDIDADGVIVVKDAGNAPITKLISGYYNMRIGGAETGGTAEQNAAIDGASAYLKGYGLSTAVTEQYTPPMNQIPVKVDVKDSEGIITGQEIKTYQFKGWYIDNNGTKVLLSTDRYYKNRITRDLDLFAGYEPTTATASTLPGVAVTNGGKDETITYYNKGSKEDPEWTTTVIAEADQANVTISGVDYYYDEKGIKRVRFNTQMNVYDSKDSNENIKKAAVLYLQLPVTDDMGNQITWTQSDLDALHLTDYESNVEGAVGPQIKTFIDAMSTELTAGSSYYAKSSSSAITITRDGTTYNAKLIAYNYIVKWSTTEADYDANDCAVLTTKNRIEYVLPMRADYYEGVDADGTHVPGSNSAVITYAAIYYDDDTDNIEAQWIESDNYVAYTHDLQPTVSNSGEG